MASARHCRVPSSGGRPDDGLCVGGGMGIASCCDIRVCGLSSKFGVPVLKLGLVEAHEEVRPLVEKFGANMR